jgi:hypothetical protein
MSRPRLKFNGKEIALDDRIVNCGRAPDNIVAFTDDANVSRYHAEIELRADGYWVIDLNSSNGTSVNGERLFGERPLNEGDKILLGGTSEIVFAVESTPSEERENQAPEPHVPSVNAEVPVKDAAVDSPETAAGGVATEAAAVSAGSKNLFLVLGILGAVILLCVVGGAAAFYFGGRSQCEAKAVITKPEAGDTIANPTEVEVESDGTGCVARAVFTLDGLEIASAESEPYTTTLDPAQYPDLADGLDHSLQIVLLDENGEQIGQPVPVMLAFDTRAIQPEGTPDTTKNQQNNTQNPGGNTKSANVTLLDVQQMSAGLLKQFRSAPNYNLSSRQFLQEVQKRAAEYAVAGFSERAAAYRDVINVAFVREQNLDAPLGFVLAMSRSKFVPSKQGDNEGLWQMSNAFVTANAYNGLCGTETLADASQNGAAKAAALYMKAIVYGVFDGDPIYSAVAFGKSPADAAAWKATLPANRSDVWNVIKTAPEREQLIRFFAAGIVAENPQRFGLKNDKPLSELYRVTM